MLTISIIILTFAATFKQLSVYVGSFIDIFIYAFSGASESHLLFNTKVTQPIDLYSPGVMPVRRRKYFEKNEGLAKCISSAICAAGLSVWRIDAIRTVFIRGGGLHETALQVLALAGIGTLMGCWAVQSYKKNN